MHISKRKNNGKNTRAIVALFVVLSALFSRSGFAQVPAANLGLKASDLYTTSELYPTSDYESTDFTFDLAELPMLIANDSDHDHEKPSIKCQKVTDLDFGRAFSGISSGTVVMDPN